MQHYFLALDYFYGTLWDVFGSALYISHTITLQTAAIKPWSWGNHSQVLNNPLFLSFFPSYLAVPPLSLSMVKYDLTVALPLVLSFNCVITNHLLIFQVLAIPCRDCLYNTCIIFHLMNVITIFFHAFSCVFSVQ